MAIPTLWALVFLAIIIPPVAVLIEFGFGAEFWIDVLLWILGVIPGMFIGLFFWVVAHN